MPTPRNRRIGYTIIEIISRMREISPTLNPIILQTILNSINAKDWIACAKYFNHFIFIYNYILYCITML